MLVSELQINTFKLRHDTSLCFETLQVSEFTNVNKLISEIQTLSHVFACQVSEIQTFDKQKKTFLMASFVDH